MLNSPRTHASRWACVPTYRPMQGKPHSPDVRGEVMTALLAGQGVAEVAERYNLSPSTVKNWKRRLADRKLTEINPEKEDEFGDLLSAYLREVLTTLQVQARHARDLDWLKTQPASELGVLHGILCDKGIRILEAAERANEPLAPGVP